MVPEIYSNTNWEQNKVSKNFYAAKYLYSISNNKGIKFVFKNKNRWKFGNRYSDHSLSQNSTENVINNSLHSNQSTEA